MKAPPKTVEITVERTIPAPPEEVFAAWLDPRTPGTLWHEHVRLIFQPQVDGLWYLHSAAHRPGGVHHYGRFIEMDRPHRIQHSWLSRNTLGEESVVTVTFRRKGRGTVMVLRHSGLPDEDAAAAHEKGWHSMLDQLGDHFAGGPPGRKMC